MIFTAMRDPGYLLAVLTALVVGLTVHEYAHAWMAYRFGDDTAYRQGRLTLDPRKHIDPFGALVFLLVGFGWAKPVPIDPWRLSRQEILMVALAGPVSNVILATFSGLTLRMLAMAGMAQSASFLIPFLFWFTFYNLLLAFFNMMPIAPLDGWKVLLGVVPAEWVFKLQSYERHAPIILLVLIFAPRLLNLPFNPIWDLLSPPIRLVWYVIVGPGVPAPI